MKPSFFVVNEVYVDILDLFLSNHNKALQHMPMDMTKEPKNIDMV